MPETIRLVFDGAAMDELLHGSKGPVARYMMTRSEIVKRASVIQCPKLTGRLSKSIVKRMSTENGELNVRIVAMQPYALWVHEGTRPHVILPKKPGGVLVFQVNGQTVFAKKVNHPGTAPRRFLTDNLHLFFA